MEAIEIMQITEKDLVPTLKRLQGYLKATSLLWLRVLGVPVLPGLIIPDWSLASARKFHRFCAKNEFQEVLLRIDKQFQRWTNRRGGYLVPVDEMGEAVRELARERTLAIALEPVSPYTDRYSLAAVTEPEQSSMTIEVVGPGFDASDLLRADIQPHQRLTVEGWSLSRRNFNSCCTYMASPQTYRESVKQRLVKIGTRLRNPAFPKLVKQSSSSDMRALRNDAIMYLTQCKNTLLLDHQDAFEPVPEKYVLRFVRDVNRLVSGLASHGLHFGPTSLSASVVSSGRLVFWDFFPARSQDIEALYHYAAAE